MPKPFWLVAPLCVVLVSTHASAQSTPWETSTAAGLQAYQQGRYGEAEEYFSAALKGAENFGPEDPHLATRLNNLAVLYRTQASTPRPSHSTSAPWRSGRKPWDRSTPT